MSLNWDKLIEEARLRRIESQVKIPTIMVHMNEEDKRYSGCGSGWNVLLINLDKDLSKICSDYKIYQYKEKWGKLCVHASPADKSVRDIFNVRIEQAEEESLTICEICGSPGKLNKSMPIRTLCNEHWAQTSPKKHLQNAVDILEALKDKQDKEKS